MEFNIIEFVNNLTIIQLVVFIIVVEFLELASGIIRAWQKQELIRSAVTRESIAKKFELWKYIFALVAFSLWIGQDAVAKMLLVFVVIPELTSIVENIVRSFARE